MKYSYRLKRSCGTTYSNGNILFTADGTTVLAPIGNRINVFDLIHQTTEALPFETKKDIDIIALSYNSKYLIAIDTEGFGCFYHFTRKLLLHSFNFRRKVFSIKFSYNDEYFAITSGRGCQIWKTPSLIKEFMPLKLLKSISGAYDETVSLDWSSNSRHLILGSKDLTARVYFNVPTSYMSLSILVGHRDHVIGVYFAKEGKEKGKNDNLAYSIAGDGGVFVWKYSKITLPVTTVSEKNQKKGKGFVGKRPLEKVLGESSEDTSEEENSSEEEEGGNAEEESDEELDDEGNKKANNEKVSEAKKHRKGVFQLAERHLLRDNQQGEISCCSFHKPSNLMILGFSSGIFSIYDMPDCINVHRLSVSSSALSSLSINNSGEWIGIGIASLGQLLVWEWKSESYILKQQGHSYGLNVLDISSEGQFIATGGDDGKVKIWNVSSGFCVVTFKEHLGPITGVKFIGFGQGKAILSSSLDGTVRAHDLLRYKNFRTLTSPTSVQFSSLTADLSGEIVCAGSQDPFQIYVWSLQTGKLLEILSGHEGPISCLAFSSSTSTLASGSWDGTLKLWNVYDNSCTETFEHGCDILRFVLSSFPVSLLYRIVAYVLFFLCCCLLFVFLFSSFFFFSFFVYYSCSFRSDGKEIACTATDGNIYFWNIDSGEQIKVIEGRRDLIGGRTTTDRKTKENSLKSKFFNSISYSSDGTSILVGGKSKYICIYAIATGVLVKKFQLSHNKYVFLPFSCCLCFLLFLNFSCRLSLS
jgi:periodic tryptophan protein 2